MLDTFDLKNYASQSGKVLHKQTLAHS